MPEEIVSLAPIGETRESESVPASSTSWKSPNL